MEALQNAFLPSRAMLEAARTAWETFFAPLTPSVFGSNFAASAELFERLTRRYDKPAFGFQNVEVEGRIIPLEEQVIWERPFCRLLHFARMPSETKGLERHALLPKLLIVAPLSGHYATLLRGTAKAFLPFYDVYITDWVNARMVPLQEGSFDLDDYIDYLIEIFHHLGKGVHSIGVCQPAVPLIASVALMSSRKDPCLPASMVLMGGPIDTRRSPTLVNVLAQERGSKWFRENCVHSVPYPYPGHDRAVYPGFLQLYGFMAMNADRHVNAHIELFNHLVEHDGDSVEKHRVFYDEYLSVMDLTAEFFLQTVDTVFVRHDLPEGTMRHRSELIDLRAIEQTALMTIEGEKDDISGIGQTYAAQELCSNLPEILKCHHMQENVGHYGVFNGSRFRNHIVPRICSFLNQVDQLSAERSVTHKKRRNPKQRGAGIVLDRRGGTVQEGSSGISKLLKGAKA